MSTIALARNERIGHQSPSGSSVTGRVYADFVVDGLDLSTRVNRKGDFASILGWGQPGTQDLTRSLLLVQSPAILSSNRVAIYVCPECGDIGCGAVAVRIERHGDTVTWSDFWFESDDDEVTPFSNAGLADLGPYHFAWREYESAIRSGYGIGGFDGYP